MNDAPIVEMKGITKRFPGVVANEQVYFSLREGEIHALLGENGAGKSTLMCILSGLYRQDEGEILIRGRGVCFRSPRDALSLGIGMIHQHFNLIASHTVTENVVLGLDPVPFLLKAKEKRREIADISLRYGFQVDPAARIWQLSVAEQQRVEIIKVLLRRAKILILDEPTAVLTPCEVEELFRILRRLKEEGTSIVLISHKLREIMEISDRITVMRAGRVVKTVKKEDTDTQELAHLMVGHDISPVRTERASPPGEVVLEALELFATGDRGIPTLKGISFQLHGGEILGVVGVAGNGQRELAKVLFGLWELTLGTITVAGTCVGRTNPRKMADLGISLIPEDRLGMGLVSALAVAENLILRHYRKEPLSHGAFLQPKPIDDFAESLIERHRITVPDRKAPVRLLSGGNLQKIVLARELTSRPRVLIAFHPTRGLDIAATQDVHLQLLQERDNGTVILLISEDLEEALHLSDRIAVIFDGKFRAVLPGAEASLERIGLLMGGGEPSFD